MEESFSQLYDDMPTVWLARHVSDTRLHRIVRRVLGAGMMWENWGRWAPSYPVLVVSKDL